MIKHTEVMKLALEALEKYCTPYQDGTHPADEAITALREALAEQPAQPSKPWVGLTEDDLVDVVPESNTPMSLGEAFVKYARAIESKLKEKNT